MELILRKAEEKDLDGLDQVMLVISDKALRRLRSNTHIRRTG